jgi:hypothetical protein
MRAAQALGQPPGPVTPSGAPPPKAPSGSPPPMGHAVTRPGGADAGPAPDAPRVLAGFLVSFDSDELGTFWPIHQGRTTIGRKDAAEGLDLEIDHPTTSSRHAVILATARPGRLEIEDLGSTNGTFLENEKITTGTRYELRDGASLRFGGYAVMVKVI